MVSRRNAAGARNAGELAFGAGLPGRSRQAPATAYGPYARVAAHDRRDDLDRQEARLTTWAAKAGGQVVRVAADVGSGMNGSRTQIRRMLADPKVTAVVVEHRDRLGRMNTELVESARAEHGRRLVVVDDGEVDDDLVRDLVEVLTSCCARRYGRRAARNRALQAVGCAQRDIGPQAALAERVGAQREDSGHA